LKLKIILEIPKTKYGNQGVLSLTAFIISLAFHSLSLQDSSPLEHSITLDLQMESYLLLKSGVELDQSESKRLLRPRESRKRFVEPISPISEHSKQSVSPKMRRNFGKKKKRYGSHGYKKITNELRDQLIKMIETTDISMRQVSLDS
jgi:hypothetical protein